MEELVCAEEYTVAQLRAWLRKLSLPTSGTKSALAIRISSVPQNERGVCPTGCDENIVETQADIQTSDQSQAVLSVAAVNSQIVDNNNINENGNDGQSEERGKSNNELDLNGHSNNNSGGINEQRSSVDNADSEREVQFLRREINILKRETELLQRMAEVESRAVSVSAQLQAEIGESKISKEMLLSILPEFDGNINSDVWMTQWENVCNVYALSENNKRMLLLSKLKGKALQWIHSKPNFAIVSVDLLIMEMKDIFRSKESKLQLRRKFEARKWKTGEAFIDYFNDKVLLSEPMQLTEDELIEYTFEGITDEQLRTQAYMQCYSTKAQLLQAFTKIKMKGEKFPIGVTQRETRCYNCNSRGHLAAECKKPKRERGACYACGSMNHRVFECPDRKKSVQLVDEYNAS
ncbi:unnamed protein product [Ceratitis capitata]|uniref:(Mediterranean fruit fly) hypothetical protein n=1 Tax=Ceratitis capitata TaxID=7213 RepID=A0A811UQT9_CERCA|nr:unnamed protein product [Ceratitis capitata]